MNREEAFALVQGTDEWRQARCGSLGASSVHEALAKLKSGGWGAGRANCRARLVVERLTGIPTVGYTNAAMQAGIDMEPAARAAYEFLTGEDVAQIGLAFHPKLIGTHASPDGLVGAHGCLEVKCPQPAQHLATLQGEPIPNDYRLQMLWQMRCCERNWCDFVSYNAAFPEHLRLHVQRVHADLKEIAEVEREVTIFLGEVTRAIADLEARYGAA